MICFGNCKMKHAIQKDTSPKEQSKEPDPPTIPLHSGRTIPNEMPCCPHLQKMSQTECRQLADDIALWRSGCLPRVQVECLDIDKDDTPPTS